MRFAVPFSVALFTGLLAACERDAAVEGGVCEKAGDCGQGLWCLGGICQKAPGGGAGEWVPPGEGDAGVAPCVADADLDTMVDVPAGPFWMGCNEAVDEECFDDEKPYHLVTLSAFKIDKYAVTVGQYFRCVDNGACTHHFDNGQCIHDSDGKAILLPRFRGAMNPMVCVDWDQAKAYCAWVGKRLPTEAEREKAARGDDGRKYPRGNGSAPTCAIAVIDDPGGGGPGCGVNGTMPVGCKPMGASPYGAQDMVGNVFEWVAGWYWSHYYEISPSLDPKGPSSARGAVMRGGAWVYQAGRMFRVSKRLVSDTWAAYDSGGFRCAR
ncbi:MAG: SUMF1/EgtB/PvdO family nonheme iron enzyme [Deltaproteobacteria bacterium]|nr:SUMF1/EgtB/PvdO family nonheme iron enzyme [Deltaproteobacteria bacterium]